MQVDVDLTFEDLKVDAYEVDITGVPGVIGIEIQFELPNKMPLTLTLNNATSQRLLEALEELHLVQ